MNQASELQRLCGRLFDRGLGELTMLHVSGTQVMVGNLVKDKGSLVLRDTGLLKSTTPASVAPCWDIGIVGAVCELPDQEWQSLSFLGADRCTIPVDLSSTRHRLLRRVTTGSGESVIDFRGSVYRGFRVMLDAHLLPLVLPLVLAVEGDRSGLAVCDFRFASAPLDALVKINDLVRAAVDRNLKLSVDDLEMDAAEFQRLFGSYLEPDAGAGGAGPRGRA